METLEKDQTNTLPVEDKSNYTLVGMWAYILDEKRLKIRKNVFIYGKVTDEIYIVQICNAFTGSPNVARLVNISQMKEWLFIPNQETHEYVMYEYDKDHELTIDFKLD
jgi:hypothetical protein